MKKNMQECKLLLGMSKINDDEVSMGHLFKKANGEMINQKGVSLKDCLNVERDVFYLLEKGYIPTFISDYVHFECWKYIVNCEEPSEIQYFHGANKYFNICERSTISEDYIKLLSDDSIAEASMKMQGFNVTVQNQVEEKLKTHKNLDTRTKESYIYMLNEPYYNDLRPLYTLKNKQNNYYSFFGYDDYCIMQISGIDPNSIFSYGDALYDDTMIFDDLENDCDIAYMSMDGHIQLWIALSQGYTDEVMLEFENGIKKYLRYCKDNKIFEKLPNDVKKDCADLYNIFGTNEKKRAKTSCKQER